jgi:hypothetical protein
MKTLQLQYQKLVSCKLDPELLIIKVSKSNIRKMLKDGEILPFQNIRGAKIIESKSIEKGIRQNLISHPKEFMCLSQGVTGTCKNYIDNQNINVVTINFDENDGQMNGGHLFKQFSALVNDNKVPDSATLKIELWVGLNEIVAKKMPITHNHSRNVKEFAIKNYNGDFNPIIKHWVSIPGSENIGFMENTGNQPGDECVKNFSLISGLVTTEQSYRNMNSLYGGIIPAIVKIPFDFSEELLKFIDYVQYEIYCGNHNYDCKLANLGRGYLKESNKAVKFNRKTKQPLRSSCSIRDIKLTFHKGTVPYELPKHIWCPLLHVLGELLVNNTCDGWVLGSLDETEKFWSKYCEVIMNKIDQDLLEYTVTRPGKKTDILEVKTDPKKYAEDGDGDIPIRKVIQGWLKQYKSLAP